MNISIIGAGHVGAVTALRIAEKGLTDKLVLIDVIDGVAKGKALDLMHAEPIENHNTKIIGTNDYADIKDSNIVIVTAGLARTPGMTRDDLAKKNTTIISAIALQIKKYAPDSIVIVVTNPVDIMSYVTLKTTGFEPKKVIGMAGILDSTRFRTHIAEELNISKSDVHSLVLGSHGDSMVPVPEYTSVAGIPISELLTRDVIERLAERTRNSGGEIIGHLKTGSAFFAPASSITEMVEAIVKDNKKVLPASVYLQGEYGYNDIYLGVPIILGKNGVEKIIELNLKDKTKEALNNSARIIEEGINQIKEDFLLSGG